LYQTDEQCVCVRQRREVQKSRRWSSEVRRPTSARAHNSTTVLHSCSTAHGLQRWIQTAPLQSMNYSITVVQYWWAKSRRAASRLEHFQQFKHSAISTHYRSVFRAAAGRSVDQTSVLVQPFGRTVDALIDLAPCHPSPALPPVVDIFHVLKRCCLRGRIVKFFYWRLSLW